MNAYTKVVHPFGCKPVAVSTVYWAGIEIMAEAEPDGASERAELVVFTSREAYVYRIPPASTTGHRADTWGVDDWLQAQAHLHSCLRTAPCLLRDTAGPGGLLNCQAVLPVLLSR
jgi:hypothetical protein